MTISRNNYEKTKEDMTRIANDPRNAPELRKLGAEAIVEVQKKLNENN